MKLSKYNDLFTHMMALTVKNDPVTRLKFELMDRYLVLMIFILISFTAIYKFHIQDKMIFHYLICGILFLSITYFFSRKRYSQNLIVNTYMILAPIYNIFVMAAFWNDSIATFFWLLPIPLGAHIFFSKKAMIMYTVYALITIVIAIVVAHNPSILGGIGFSFFKHTQKEIMFSDTFLFISNILVIALLIYYKGKIRKQEMFQQQFDFIESQKEIIKEHKNQIKRTSKSPSDQIDTEIMKNVFDKIEVIMTQQMLFKDVKLNLSKVSVSLDVNSAYISKAIRYKGYTNFNTFLNMYRINYVKKLFSQTDFQKSTLMYVYTEAGFSNQSTFNRVFKQFEGITPSEYIQQKLNTQEDV